MTLAMRMTWFLKGVTASTTAFGTVHAPFLWGRVRHFTTLLGTHLATATTMATADMAYIHPYLSSPFEHFALYC